MSDYDRARQLRRRHMHERQAVIFGVLLAAMAVIGLGAAAVFTGAITLPGALGREFAAEPTPTVSRPPYPCPPEGATPVGYADVQVAIYNGAGVQGLAGSTGDQLAARGFTITAKENAPAEYEGFARISFGAPGVAAAYTLAAQLPDSVLVLDAREGGDVSLTLGTQYEALQTPEAITLDPNAPLPKPDGCVPLDQLVVATAPAG